MKKLVLILVCLVLASAAFAGDKSKSMSMTGVITDKACSGDKAKAANAECAKKCIERDKAAVFVSDKDGKVTPIHNVEAIAGHEGHHVKITGSMMGDSLHVDKVDMMAAKKGS